MIPLPENVNLILGSAEVVFIRMDYTSSTILYFKALFVAYDAMLLSKVHKVPKDQPP